MERYLFAAGCFLALVSYWLFRRLAAERRDTDATGRVAFSKLDLVVVAAIFLLAGILRAINMNQTLWWDELATVVRVVKRGLGVGICSWGGAGHASTCNAKINPDGSVDIELGSQDLGTGTRTIIAQVAAESLGLPVNAVKVKLGDNSLPPSNGSGGSTTVGGVSSSTRIAPGSRTCRYGSSSLTIPIARRGCRCAWTTCASCGARSIGARPPSS